MEFYTWGRNFTWKFAWAQDSLEAVDALSLNIIDVKLLSITSCDGQMGKGVHVVAAGKKRDLYAISNC